ARKQSKFIGSPSFTSTRSLQLAVLQLRAGLRIIRQRSLVAKYATGADKGRAADVATAAGDCILDLRGCAYTRVTPDNGILNSRALFDVTAFTEHGIDDLYAGLDDAIVRDD